MINDQAHTLRTMLRSAVRSSSAETPQPLVVGVAAGKGGVGTTTVAVNLAIQLSQSGSQVVLADGNQWNADVAVHCDLDSPNNALHDPGALQQGPGGILVLAAHESVRASVEGGADRLPQVLQAISATPAVDYVIVDLGNGSDFTKYGCRHRLHRLVLVTTTEMVAVMDAYAALKRWRLQCPEDELTVHLVVNEVSDESAAQGVWERIAATSRRFLAVNVLCAGCIPLDNRFSQEDGGQTPLVLRFPQCPAAHALQDIVTNVFHNSCKRKADAGKQAIQTKRSRAWDS
jgi:flagellar biosynthesis protein FlhG